MWSQLRTIEKKDWIDLGKVIAWGTVVGFSILFWVLMAIVWYVSRVEAAPFLLANKPTTGTTEWYQCTGLWFPATDQITPVSTGDFKIDMANCPVGSFTVTIKACNVWGCGPDSSPFTFTKGALPGIPSNTRLTKD